MSERKGLGRGLSALLGEDKELSSAIGITSAKLDENKDKIEKKLGNVEKSKDSFDIESNLKSSKTSIKEVNLSDLEVSEFQPRVHFDEDSLKGLVESIKEKGILQPLLVRSRANGKFEIIAGERRFRGATEAGIKKVPVIIRDFTDQEVLEVALIENLQRENLNAIEEANGYKKLLEEFHHTQEELAKVVGKSRSHVANMLRLTSLSDTIKDMVVDGALSAGHARALLSAKKPEELAKKVVAKNLSVRQTETLAMGKPVKSAGKKGLKKPQKGGDLYKKDSDILALENEISKRTGLSSSINFDGKSGELILFYDNLEELDFLVKKICSTSIGSEYVSVNEEVEMGISPENLSEGFSVFDEEVVDDNIKNVSISGEDFIKYNL